MGARQPNVWPRSISIDSSTTVQPTSASAVRLSSVRSALRRLLAAEARTSSLAREGGYGVEWRICTNLITIAACVASIEWRICTSVTQHGRVVDVENLAYCPTAVPIFRQFPRRLTGPHGRCA
jgi:hypothetical protein